VTRGPRQAGVAAPRRAILGPGTRGRLLFLALLATGCPTVDPGDNPVAPPLCRPDLETFKAEGGIWDVAINPSDEAKSCVAMAGCHSQDTGRSGLRLLVKPRASFTDLEWRMNLDVVARYLNCSTPSDSLFITKPDGTESHFGGTLWTCGGSDCEPISTIEAWIAAR
jgi:hypothetical protein